MLTEEEIQIEHKTLEDPTEKYATRHLWTWITPKGEKWYYHALVSNDITGEELEKSLDKHHEVAHTAIKRMLKRV